MKSPAHCLRLVIRNIARATRPLSRRDIAQQSRRRTKLGATQYDDASARCCRADAVDIFSERSRTQAEKWRPRCWMFPNGCDQQACSTSVKVIIAHAGKFRSGRIDANGIIFTDRSYHYKICLIEELQKHNMKKIEEHIDGNHAMMYIINRQSFSRSLPYQQNRNLLSDIFKCCWACLTIFAPP